MDDGTPVVVSSDEPKSTRKGLILIWTGATTFSKIIGVLLIVFAVFSFIQTLYFTSEQNNDAQCQAEFVEAFSSTLEERGTATRQNEDAIDELFIGVRKTLQQDEGRKESLNEAFARYDAKRQEIRKTKAENPYPGLTLSEKCSR